MAQGKIRVRLKSYDSTIIDLTPDFVGYEIPDEFVVGYGLDHAGKYRNLPEIGVLKSEVYM